MSFYSKVTVKSNGDTVKAVNEGMEGSILWLCKAIKSQAIPLAPKDTGYLQASIIYVTNLHSEGNLGVMLKPKEGYVGTNVDYAVYQEFGTRDIDPHPFIRPAAMKYADGQGNNKIIEIFNSDMAEELPKL